MHNDRTVSTRERMERLHVLALPVNGSRVRLGVGDRLDIQMRQMVGSGSEWSVVGLPDGVSLERDDHFQMGARVGGAFSSRLFQFSALRETVGQIRLALGVPGSIDVVGHVNVQVTVG